MHQSGSNPEVGRERRKPGLITRGALAVVSFMGVGCSVQASEAPTPRSTWQVSQTETTVPFDHCAELGNTDVIQQFDDTGFFTPDSEAYTFQVVDYMNMAYPDLTPQEFANQFLAAQSEELTKQGIHIEFDPNADMKEWGTGKSENGLDIKRRQQEGLVNYLRAMTEVLNDYPAGLLEELGIEVVRLADTHKEDRVGGHFKAGEVQVEYAKREEGTFEQVNKREMYDTLAHEIFGHALQNYLCNGIYNEDRSLAEGITFIGAIPSSYTDEQVREHYRKIPEEQLALGKDRVFPRDYAATTPEEYWAVLAAFTMETRGLILPGDPDFESPLYYKQQKFVERLEQVLPGFRAFLDKQTFVLRHNSESELLQVAETVNIDVAELPNLIPDAGSGQEVVVNGVVLDSDIWQYGGARDSEAITLYPGASKARRSDGTYNITINTREGLLSSGPSVENNEKFEFTVMQVPGEPLFTVIDRVQEGQMQDGFPVQYEQWTSAPESRAYLAQLEQKGARPIVYKFHNKNLEPVK